jgi:uncharacterized repeat protein (TIGR01451 family)
MLSVARTTAFRSRQSLAFLAMSLVMSSVPRPAAAADVPLEIITLSDEGTARGALPERALSPVTIPEGLTYATDAVLAQSYGGEVEPNGTSATATPIVGTNVVVKGNVWPAADVDFYSFTANAGDRVYAATMTSASAGNSTDTTLTLLASDGTTTIEFDDENGSFSANSSTIANATIPTAGTYFLRVADFNVANFVRSYELHFRLQDGSGAPTPEVEANDTPATANPLPANGWVSGTRNPAVATEQDWYSFTANAGDTVYLSLDVDPERDGVVWNGRLGIGLFGDATTQILVIDDAGTFDVIPSEAHFMTVKTAGTYFAFVDSASAAVGGPTATYTLSVSIHPATNEGVNCTTYTSTDVPKTIGPGLGLVSSVITVPGNPRIADVDVDITLNHALMQDVDAHLRSPAGNDNGLFTDIGAAAIGGQNILDVVFDDEAGIPPAFTAFRNTQLKPENNSNAGTASTSGAYRLSWFDGENAGGTWTLDLRDDTTGANGGTLTAWSLRICEPPPPPACAPGFTQTTVFSTDFESGAAGFTHSGTQDEWELGLPATVATTTANPIAAFNTCNSGVNCWKTDLDNTYNNSSNQDLLSPNINLAGLSAPVVVTWAQRHQVETANFDHMFIDARQVGGATPVRLYEWLEPTPISASAGTGNPQANIGGSAGWGVFSRRADSLAGLNSELRFHLDTDSSVQFGGLAVDDVTVTACRPLVADLAITKTDGVTTATPGGSVTYTITSSNAGTDPVTGATVADTFPASLTCTWTCVGAGGGTCTAAGSGNINDSVNLPVGGSVTHTASCSINAGATGSLSNTATVSSIASDPNPANNSATDTDTLTASADASVTKTDGVTTVTPNQNITYTITASNAGPSNAPGSTVADTFPAELNCPAWTCVGSGGGTCTAAGVGNINDSVNLPAGGSVTYSAGCSVGSLAVGPIVNTATVSSAVTDPVPGNNTATDTDTVTQTSDFSITKTDGVTQAVPGQFVTYTIVASNAGPSNGPSTLVADTFPASLSCNWTCSGAGGGTCTASGLGNINDSTNLPAGGSVTYNALCAIATSATGTLANTATVSSLASTDPNPANNSATDTDTLAGQADTSLNMTVDNATPTVGSNVTYTLTAANDGPSDAHSVTVTDLLPSGLTFVSSTPSPGTYTAGTGAWVIGLLPDNATATLSIVATVNSSQAIVNQASVTAQAETDPNRSNNSALVAVNAPGLADVQLQETVDDDTPGNGQNVTFTVSAHNDGPTAATNVVVTDNLPTGLTFVSATASQGTYTPGTGAWSVGTIASGATPTLTVVATVTTTSPVFRVVQKTQNEPDYASDNDTDSVSLNDATVSDLAMSLVASQEPVPQGTTFTYTIVVSNHGPASATNVTVTDALPAGVTLNSATATQGSCSGTTTVSCNLGTLADGTSAHVALVVTKTVGGNVSNTASVAATETDPFMPNNSNSETSTPAELTNFRIE